MADGQRRLILGSGEKYVEGVEKAFRGRSPEPPRTYDEARTLLKSGVATTLDLFNSLPVEKRLEEEAVFCLRLHPDAIAKSYEPTAIFSEVPELRNVGSRSYRSKIEDVAPTKRVTKKIQEEEKEITGRLVFVQGPEEGFKRLVRHLDRTENQLTKQFRDAVRRVEKFDLLDPAEQIHGFSKEWREGRIELTLHPSRVDSGRQKEFLFQLFEEAGVDPERSTIRPYPNGPTFVSCRATRQMLNALAGTNPLRAAHPLSFGGLPNLRNAPSSVAPLPPTSTTRSTIKVGMFDGGLDPTVPLLLGHVEEDLSLGIATPPDVDCVAHGTAVAGAILHGPLNGMTGRTPTPPVYVVSIRALPTSDRLDEDLFESIDVIERAVPARPDIKVFNLSFGPRGPVEDDPISRFTYVLDDLAHRHKVAFVIAVGNDGTVSGYDRIQAPSDVVHGIGVGAYTLSGTDRVHAPYSCKGPGRECGKVKPDVAAFGGCDNSPMHLVSTTAGQKLLQWGTSFASPNAARLCGQATASFERSSALLGRALLAHTARHPSKTPDHLLGHGCIADGIDDLLFCTDKSVTVVFQGVILPTKVVRLPIPWPDRVAIPGKLQVTWTVASLAPVDPMHPSDYTSCCLEETFYPHSQRFNFSPPKGLSARPKKLHLINDKAEVKELLKERWTQSTFPLTESGNEYKDELAKRALDCKWEPLVRRTKSKMASSIFEPFMTLHAIGRNGASARFDYAVVLTITAEKFKGDLYAEIRHKYPALAPIRVRTEAEIRVQI
ncbi:S8 family peptidase [Lacipirellula parvula]|uniref:Peptidase S8/S53 domain-containing protein n=1 Tax=Lacipirellula parvula TaxID=2650471 RepID=A0A5K7XDT3_9BACT|nr:S8 family peptidase [Lacipirellula parvula]BBO34172.1 hypothetical protein PLANPX_3784 [Lacipirellula parvula]